MINKKNNKVKIIAEVGVNHNGIKKYIYKYIDTLKKMNVDYVKFQAYNTENLVIKETKAPDYQSLNLKKKTTQYDILKKYELSTKDIKSIIDYSKKKKIKFLFSVFDEFTLKKLIKFGCRTFKISSGDLLDFKLLFLLSKYDCELLISTGMSNEKEIVRTINFLKKNNLDKNKIILFHCTSSYPAKIDELNLNAIDLMNKKFKVELGYSDHSNSQLTPIIAVSKGCKYIEKHFTLSKRLKGPDHKASFGISEFKIMIKNIRKVEKILGQSEKKIQKGEKNISMYARKSLVAKKKIYKGELFTIENLTTKRPFFGICASKWHNYLGKRSKKNYLKDQFIDV